MNRIERPFPPGARRVRSAAAATLLLALSIAACGREEEHHDASEEASAAAPTNRVEIPPAVRRSLGITFASVERRVVERTLRMPGRFELEPDGRREIRAAVPGRVETHVRPLERVERGQLLFTIDSPQWRQLQQSIAAAEAAIALATAKIESAEPMHEAHRAHGESLREAVRLWQARIAELESLRAAGAGGGEAAASARASLAAARSELAETLEKDVMLHAERRSAEASLAAAQIDRELLLESASAMLGGVPADQLVEVRDGRPLWRRLAAVEIRAAADGIVEEVEASPGGWAEPGDRLGCVVDPMRVRFRATMLQSDLGRVGGSIASARIVPPQGGPLELAAPAIEAEAEISPVADPLTRTVPIFARPRFSAEWARPGVNAYLEVVLEGGRASLAIPRRCIVLDGTKPVFFRRDPADPDRAIRIEADLGADDGRWVAVESGVRAGDEVVLDGVYPLMLSTSGAAPTGGHFHADGTWHADGHDERRRR